MALLERVATLLRANVNDMLDRAENPPAMLKQLLRDMSNQLLQVKTQVAVALADLHVLQAKCAELQQSAADWRRKAELAVAHNEEALARVAAERCLQADAMLESYAQQLTDQRTEYEFLRDRFRQLEAKLAHTEREGELALVALRRTTRSSAAGVADQRSRDVMKRIQDAVRTAGARNTASRQVENDLATSAETQLEQLEQRQRVDAFLRELKGMPPLLSNQHGERT